MKYNYIIFEDNKGTLSLNVYVSTFDDALAYINDYLITFKGWLVAGWIASSCSKQLTDEEQDLLLGGAL